MALIKPVSQSFLINGQRGRTKGVKINQERYWLKDSQPGFVAGKLHLFGGYYPEQRQVSPFSFFCELSIFNFKISRLDDCTIVELTIQLIDKFVDGFSVLAKPDGSKGFFIIFNFVCKIILAFICHGYGKNCNIFDGSGVVKTHSSSYTHLHGGLGYYNGQPTTVGSEYKDGYRKVETLAQGGWISLGDHPK